MFANILSFSQGLSNGAQDYIEINEVSFLAQPNLTGVNKLL